MSLKGTLWGASPPLPLIQPSHRFLVSLTQPPHPHRAVCLSIPPQLLHQSVSKNLVSSSAEIPQRFPFSCPLGHRIIKLSQLVTRHPERETERKDKKGGCVGGFRLLGWQGHVSERARLDPTGSTEGRDLFLQNLRND